MQNAYRIGEALAEQLSLFLTEHSTWHFVSIVQVLAPNNPAVAMICGLVIKMRFWLFRF